MKCQVILNKNVDLLCLYCTYRPGKSNSHKADENEKFHIARACVREEGGKKLGHYFKLAKMVCFSYYLYVFSSTKSENKRENRFA
jgi:hypothetical protein